MKPVVASVPGIVRHIFVAPGERVAKGHILVQLEVFGMAQQVASPVDGTVRLLLVHVGEQVSQGALLLELDD